MPQKNAKNLSTTNITTGYTPKEIKHPKNAFAFHMFIGILPTMNVQDTN